MPILLLWIEIVYCVRCTRVSTFLSFLSFSCLLSSLWADNQRIAYTRVYIEYIDWQLAVNVTDTIWKLTSTWMPIYGKRIDLQMFVKPTNSKHWMRVARAPSARHCCLIVEFVIISVSCCVSWSWTIGSGFWFCYIVCHFTLYGF